MKKVKNILFGLTVISIPVWFYLRIILDNAVWANFVLFGVVWVLWGMALWIDYYLEKKKSYLFPASILTGVGIFHVVFVLIRG